jgi:hypothetical protein
MFYVYLYLRYYGLPYYVGKGTGYRAFAKHERCHPPKDHSCIVIQYYESEQEAFEAEKFFILFFGRKDLGTGCLRNRTDGGDGASGALVSDETRKKVRDSKLGKSRKPFSKEWLAKMREAASKPKNFSKEHLDFLSKRCKEINTNRIGKPGHPQSEEAKQKIREKRLGKIKEFCKRGHKMSGDNIYIAPKTKTRNCIACIRLKHKKNYKRKKL